MQAQKILLAEDDVNLGAILSERLNIKGYDVTHAADGEKALKTFIENEFDLLILDIMMPLKDGFTLAKEIRSTNENVPIIFVTARGLKDDVLKGFSVGADDYITKPFSMEELLMRIKAILKRSNRNEKDEEQNEFNIGQFNFNYVFQTLNIKGEEHKLTSKEAELMKILCQAKNGLVLREVALRKIWGEDTYFNGRSMDVFISKLRKILSPDEAVEIMNVHGKGFKLIEKENSVN